MLLPRCRTTGRRSPRRWRRCERILVNERCLHLSFLPGLDTVESEPKKTSVLENGREHGRNRPISVAHLDPSLRTNNIMRR
jgi:hypothetical protein